MKKKTLINTLVFFTLFLGVALGTGESAPQDADAWLGTWDVAVKIDGCPGPGSDGSWPGTFSVTYEDNKYIVKWLHTEYWRVQASISGSNLKALDVDLPQQNEWELTLLAGGQKAEGYMQQRKPLGGAEDPCGRRGRMVATKRASTQEPEEKPGEKPKEKQGQFSCEISESQVTGKQVYVKGTVYGGSGTYVYSWDFGDISSSAPSGPVNSHEYECPGQYRIRLIVQDTTRHIECYCDKMIKIEVDPLELSEPFAARPVAGSYPDPFGDYYVEFLCPQPWGGVPPYSFHWDFGDNRRHIPDTLSNPIVHYYWNPGTYRVELTIYDSCNEKLGPIIQEVKIEGKIPLPVVSGGPLIINGYFSNGLSGWSQSASGYRGSPTPTSQSRYSPSITSGALEMGVFGGTRQVYQDVQISHLQLRFQASLMVDRWSTYNGNPGGWAAIGISFLDTSGKVLATTYYYARPTGPFSEEANIHWVSLGTNLVPPTRWLTVDSSIELEAKAHGLQPEMIDGLRVINIVFGTHEDQTPTIARFRDLSLTRNPQ